MHGAPPPGPWPYTRSPAAALGRPDSSRGGRRRGRLCGEEGPGRGRDVGGRGSERLGRGTWRGRGRGGAGGGRGKGGGGRRVRAPEAIRADAVRRGAGRGTAARPGPLRGGRLQALNVLKNTSAPGPSQQTRSRSALGPARARRRPAGPTRPARRRRRPREAGPAVDPRPPSIVADVGAAGGRGAARGRAGTSTVDNRSCRSATSRSSSSPRRSIPPRPRRSPPASPGAPPPLPHPSDARPGP